VLYSGTQQYQVGQLGISSDKPVPEDFDGDGKADFCLFRESKGDWHILRSYNSQSLTYRFGSPGDIPQVGDWDGDGIMDIGVYRPSNKVWYPQRGSSYLFGETGEMPTASILKVQ
jgi:hypothetical protein